MKAEQKSDFETLVAVSQAKRTILKFIKTNEIPAAITLQVLGDLRDNPKKYIESVQIAGETHYIFARAVMQKMLELNAKVL